VGNQFRPYTKAEKRELSEMQRVARLIARCFNGVSFDRNTFTCGDYIMKSASGETKFYESTPMNAAIRKMNRVTRWMTRHKPMTQENC